MNPGQMTFHVRLKRFAMIVVCGALVAMTVVPGGNATGHGIFKKALEKKYKAERLRVTCNMCHVKGKKKTERNDVGKIFFDEFKGMGLSKKWQEVEGDERKKFEKEVMEPALLKALEKIYAKEKAGEVETKLNQQIPAGEVAGTTLRKKKDQ